MSRCDVPANLAHAISRGVFRVWTFGYLADKWITAEPNAWVALRVDTVNLLGSLTEDLKVLCCSGER